MTEKAKWITLIVGSFIVAAGLITLIYFQNTVLEENRVEVERLKGEIDVGRKLVMTTPDLEREVIVQRETDEVIKETLSDDEEITNFVRTINDFELASGISITSLKKQKVDTRHKSKSKEDFDRVGYTITFDADAFQFLSFLDALESHARFISVTAFKLTGAKRSQIDRGGEAVHAVSLNLETYVYTPKAGSDEVEIDNYERKRDLLLADIQKRSSELRVPTYDYRGPRGRRDPWIDPRIAVDPSKDTLTIQEQSEIVEGLEAQAEEVESFWGEVREAKNLIEEMKARAKLDEAMVKLDEELRRLETDELISFSPAQRRLKNNVISVQEDIRVKLFEGRGSGPTVKELEEVAAAVRRHLDFEEYDEAIQAYQTMAPRLADAERDVAKRPLVEELQLLASRAQTVLDFEGINMQIGGVAVMEGVRPVALINGETVVAGEYLDLTGELFVSDIRSHEIEFVYQGVTLIRRLEDQGPNR
ncbi:MAG: hypothetical protein AAF682_13675 [Planctomycetota bacterium]